MKNTKLRALVFGFVFMSSSPFAMTCAVKFDLPSPNISVDNVDKIPDYCTSLALKLFNQPLFTGKSPYPFISTCKILPLKDWTNCRISDILSENACEYLSNAWTIKDFASGCDQFYTAEGSCIDYGITLWIFDNHEMCTIDDLNIAYKSVIEELKNGWTSSTLRENPDIMFKKPKTDWYLFIKKSYLSHEDTLIYFLTRKFGVENKIECHCEWLKIPYGCECRNTIYLWVKKDAFDEFKQIFRFYLTIPNSL